MASRIVTRPFGAGEVIYKDGGAFTHAVFPHAGVLSLMAYMGDGKSVEKASIGLEGFLGFVMIMGGGDRAISTSVGQVPGYASWLSVADLDEALSEFICVRETMLRYGRLLISQTMESVACNSLHSAEQRIVRWLLHAHDRVESERFAITQQAIAEVLGLRRATVSVTCSRLQEEGALDYSRGILTIANRALLEARACECYQRIRRFAV
ncbi:MAG: Crp/Fnr family transcriptional regulator [Devosia sp.]|nr:Crp/Fnr family transcriptional regulator [Devosia sp.]